VQQAVIRQVDEAPYSVGFLTLGQDGPSSGCQSLTFFVLFLFHQLPRDTTMLPRFLFSLMTATS
jgi:hypothetical protein